MGNNSECRRIVTWNLLRASLRSTATAALSTNCGRNDFAVRRISRRSAVTQSHRH